MSNRAQITQQAARDGVPAPAVERDYVLAHIIAGLGSLGDKHGLVCKGGDVHVPPIITFKSICYFGYSRLAPRVPSHTFSLQIVRK